MNKIDKLFNEMKVFESTASMYSNGEYSRITLYSPGIVQSELIRLFEIRDELKKYGVILEIEIKYNYLKTKQNESNN